MQSAVLALRFEPYQRALHSLQRSNSLAYIVDMLLQQFVYVSAGRLLLMSEVSQSPHLVLAKSKFLTAKDELQPFLVRVFIAAVAVRQTCGLWQQSDLFVVPDSLCRTIAGPCKFTDAQLKQLFLDKGFTYRSFEKNSGCSLGDQEHDDYDLGDVPDDHAHHPDTKE